VLRAVTSGIVLCLLLSACGHAGHVNKYTDSLVKQKLGETGYNISLPKNYMLKLLPGKDYAVYRFQPQDTTDTISLRGGVFFGNFPGMDNPDSANCKTDSIKSPLLDTVHTWLRFSNKTSYEIQVIIPIMYPDGEPTKMYAFGRSPKADLPKLQAVFSTVEIER